MSQASSVICTGHSNVFFSSLLLLFSLSLSPLPLFFPLLEWTRHAFDQGSHVPIELFSTSQSTVTALVTVYTLDLSLPESEINAPNAQ